MKHIIGNLLTDSYDDLYLSENMIHLMKENKKIVTQKTVYARLVIMQKNGR